MSQEQLLPSVTELPTTLSALTNLPQLTLEELDAIHQSTLAGKTDEELKQIIESASNGAEVVQYEYTSKEYELTYEDKDFIKKSAQNMYRLLDSGKYTVNHKTATSIVVATNLMKKVASGEKTAIGYSDYHHILQAMSADFQGNSTTAKTIHDIFITMGNISLDLANAKARIQNYTILYTQSADYLDEREAKRAEEAGEIPSEVVKG